MTEMRIFVTLTMSVCWLVVVPGPALYALDKNPAAEEFKDRQFYRANVKKLKRAMGKTQ